MRMTTRAKSVWSSRKYFFVAIVGQLGEPRPYSNVGTLGYPICSDL